MSLHWKSLMCCVLFAVGWHAPSAVAGQAGFDPAPVRAALQRLLPRHAEQFEVLALPAEGEERFRVDGRKGHIRIAGSTPLAALVGVQAYLHEVARVDIGWPGDSLSRLPRRLPVPAAPLEGGTSMPDRFALNDTDDGYANAYLDWPAWQRKIDLLALHGFNQVFVPVGQEEVYRRSFSRFGYSDAEIRAWIPAPAHQPWWLLQNMSGFAAPVSVAQYARRVELGQRIVTRLRELGMTPVFPGYFGTVPQDFAVKHPEARVVPQGQWVGFTRPDWLDPCDPLYARIAATFYAEQRALFGASQLYKMDLLHEGGKAGDVSVGAAAGCVAQALRQAHPEARWVLLGWQHNPPADVIRAAGAANLLIVDGLSDRYDNLDRERDWLGAPYAFGSIPNFGGHRTLGANAGVWLQRYPAWHRKSGSALRGIAWMPEASGIDPAAFSLFADLAWQDAPPPAQEWFGRYGAYRYGGADPHAVRAWQMLARSAYAGASGEWSESQDSLFNARPSLDAGSAAAWSPPGMRYEAGVFERAASELMQVAPALKATSAWRHDVVDMARQALVDHARELLPLLRAAYQRRDPVLFRTLSAEWLNDMALLDRLLATSPEFLLGRWLQAALQAAGDDAEEVARLRYDQLSLISHWGDRSGSDKGHLHDYANRELSGLVGGLYRARWQRYFAALEKALADGSTPEQVDWFAMEQEWSRSDKSYPVTPAGDPGRVAAEVVAHLRTKRRD